MLQTGRRAARAAATSARLPRRWRCRCRARTPCPPHPPPPPPCWSVHPTTLLLLSPPLITPSSGPPPLVNPRICSNFQNIQILIVYISDDFDVLWFWFLIPLLKVAKIYLFVIIKTVVIFYYFVYYIETISILFQSAAGAGNALAQLQHLLLTQHGAHSLLLHTQVSTYLHYQIFHINESLY